MDHTHDHPTTTDGDGGLSFDELLAEASPRFEVVPVLLAGELAAEYEAIRERIEERRTQRDTVATVAAMAAKRRVDAGDDRLSTKLPDPAGDPARDPDGDPGDGPDAEQERDPEQDRLDELAAQLRRRWLRVRVEALPGPDYTDLAMQHPPRVLPDGRMDPRDAGGVNRSTFYTPLLHQCIKRANERVMTPADAATLVGKLNSEQYDELANAAARVNRIGYTNIPF